MVTKMVEMFQKYYNNNKKSMFPNIKDWSKPPLYHLRHKNNIKQLTHKEWFFLHPSAYNLISFTITIAALINFIGLALIAHYWLHITTVAVISTIIGATQVYALIKKIHAYPCDKHTTFYDLWMREDQYIKSEEEIE